MKSIFIIITLLIGWGSVNGQAKKTNNKNTSAVANPTITKKESNSNIAEKNTKPSLDETVKYINNILKSSIGVIWKYNIEPSSNFNQLVNQEFSLNEYSYFTEQFFASSSEINKREMTYSNINWGSLLKIDSGAISVDLLHFTLQFDSPLISGVSVPSNNEKRSSSSTSMTLYVLPNKAENLRKALLHLKELTYKPDPFD